MHVPFPGTVLPHEFVAVKSPVVNSPGTATVPEALFVTVTVLVAVVPTSTLPKFSVVSAAARSTIPTPVSGAVSVFAGDTTVRVPARVPSAVGANTTSISQLAPPATEPHGADVIR